MVSVKCQFVCLDYIFLTYTHQFSTMYIADYNMKLVSQS